MAGNDHDARNVHAVAVWFPWTAAPWDKAAAWRDLGKWYETAIVLTGAAGTALAPYTGPAPDPSPRNRAAGYLLRSISDMRALLTLVSSRTDEAGGRFTLLAGLPFLILGLLFLTDFRGFTDRWAKANGRNWRGQRGPKQIEDARFFARIWGGIAVPIGLFMVILGIVRIASGDL